MFSIVLKYITLAVSAAVLAGCMCSPSAERKGLVGAQPTVQSEPALNGL